MDVCIDRLVVGIAISAMLMFVTRNLVFKRVADGRNSPVWGALAIGLSVASPLWICMAIGAFRPAVVSALYVSIPLGALTAVWSVRVLKSVRDDHTRN